MWHRATVVSSARCERTTTLLLLSLLARLQCHTWLVLGQIWPVGFGTFWPRALPDLTGHGQFSHVRSLALSALTSPNVSRAHPRVFSSPTPHPVVQLALFLSEGHPVSSRFNLNVWSNLFIFRDILVLT